MNNRIMSVALMAVGVCLVLAGLMFIASEPHHSLQQSRGSGSLDPRCEKMLQDQDVRLQELSNRIMALETERDAKRSPKE